MSHYFSFYLSFMFHREYPETGIEDDMDKKPKVTAQLSQSLGDDPANYVAKVSFPLNHQLMLKWR